MPYKDKQQLYKKQIQRWIDRKIKAIEYLGGKCVSCGYDKYYGALHFHHKDPSTKSANWNKVRLWNWEKVEKELDKCDLLCANCHAEAHRKE